MIVVDSMLLLSDYLQKACLSPINTGAVVYRPTPRGPHTFVPLLNWPSQVRRRSGKLKYNVAEVAIEDGVKDILRYALRADEVKSGEVIRNIWIH